MFSSFKSATAAIITLLSFSFAQDVTLTIDGTSLNYESTADIYGFQFNHDGCAEGASGGDAADVGFTISTSASVVLAFSFSGSYIPAGNGMLALLTIAGSGVACLSEDGLIISSDSGVQLSANIQNCNTIYIQLSE